MVVVSGNWTKNVVHYSSSKITNDNTNNIIMEDTEIMHSSAKAILECRPNSHQFQERFLTLEQPVKVGRSVARAKPTSNNAIFDCKVLSRHHAVLWYENGKFYLQDTKSSNGTFVNNNRLTTAGHEVSSGDIVQFGVDVLENNKKVTHGCIIATLKLFLPDGKEAKASPSITEGNIRGIVPFDDLYTLNQIIQEASQREQCLESKLTALQNVVDETKKSAEESWQAYVGEERLLSRLSALEIQLQQVKSNWSDDKLKEEIAKLRENNENYQEAAKIALEKVHSEKQQAVVLALEQERAKIAAEQDALLAREQLEQAHSEIQEIAQKITNIQNMADEEKRDYEKEIKQLQQQLEQEEAKITELESKIYELKVEAGKKNNYKGIDEFPEIICEDDDVRRKEEILAENETMSELNKANLICLSANNNNQFGQFAPFLLPDNEEEFEKEKFDKMECDLSLINSTEEEKCEKEKSEEIESESNDKNDNENCELKNNNKEEGKRVSFNIPTDLEESQNTESSSPSNSENEDESNNFPNDTVDSKTLKYQYQSAQREQIELRRKIGILERNSETNKLKIVELNKALNEERDLSGQRLSTCDHLKEELQELEKKWLESNEENKKLIERVDELVIEFEDLKNVKNDEVEVGKISSLPPNNESSVRSVDTQCNNNNNQNNAYSLEESQNSLGNTSSVVSSEELTNIEEELVLFKERYAGICEEKLKLHKDLLKLKSQYDSLCDNMYNKYFWYIGPLVILIFYLLLKECIS